MPFLPQYLIVTTAFELYGSELEHHDFPSVVSRTASKQLYQLNVPNSMGPYGIHPHSDEGISKGYAGLLSTIQQRSRESGEVPADWKLVNGIPNYKKK